MRRQPCGFGNAMRCDDAGLGLDDFLPLGFDFDAVGFHSHAVVACALCRSLFLLAGRRVGAGT